MRCWICVRGAMSSKNVRSRFKRSDLSALAAIVVSLAESDGVCGTILDAAADELFTMLCVIAERLGLDDEYPVGLAGGI